MIKSKRLWLVLALVIVAVCMFACSYDYDDTQKKCIVTLIADTNREVEIKYGEKLSSVNLNPNSSDETKAMNFFAGWFVDKEMSIRYNSSEQIYSDIILYGKYISFSDSIIEFMRYKNMNNDVYFSYNIRNSPYFYSLLSAYLKDKNDSITIDYIKNVYNTDGTGKDNIYVSIIQNTSGTKSRFDWNIIKGNGTQAILLSDAAADITDNNVIVYPTGSVAQYVNFNSVINYQLKKSSSVKLVTIDYHSGFFSKDYVTEQAKSNIWFSAQVINDVLLKEVAEELNLKIQ